MVKGLIEVADYYRRPGNPKRVVYKDISGQLYDGPPRNVEVGDKLWIEYSAHDEGEKYIPIVKFIKH